MSYEVYFGFNTIPCNEFIYRVFTGEAERVRELLKADPSLANSRDNDGNPAVNWAISQSRAEVLRELLKYKPTLSPSPLGDPIDIAVRVVGPEVLAELISVDGLIPSWRNREGVPAFLLAVKAQQIDNARLLVQSGADVNVVDSAGESALHYAVRTENEALLNFIVSMRPDPTLRNASNMTAGEVLQKRAFNKADRSFRNRMIEILRNYEKSHPRQSGSSRLDLFLKWLTRR